MGRRLVVGAIALAIATSMWPAESPARNAGGGFSSGGRAVRESDSSDSGSRSAPDSSAGGMPGSDEPAPKRVPKPKSWTTMARGFLMGGVLGSMLLGRRYGGIGVVELAVLCGLIVLAFRALSRYQETVPAGAYGGPRLLGAGSVEPEARQAPGGASARDEPGDGQEAARALDQVIAEIRAADPGFAPARFAQTVDDLFRRVQAAWTARDMGVAADVLTVELRQKLQKECDRLRSAGRINRVERITLRQAAITRAWRDHGWEQVGVQVVATLIDYTTDEAGRKVLAGNPFEPVQLLEHWELVRPTGSVQWRVSAMR
jgi:predicted lipid-binding transport protein (Tim44 family)